MTLGAPTTAAQDSSLNITGDFRWRSEWDAHRTNNPDRFRPRVRFRLNLGAQLAPNLRVTARLVTNTGDANSTHQTLGGGFADFAVALDRAYLQWSVPIDRDLWLLAGKFGNPVTDPGPYSEVVWDADVQLEGLAAIFKPVGSITLVAARYILLQRSGANVGMTSGQARYSNAFNDDFRIGAAVGGYIYDTPDAAGAQILLADDQGNSVLTDGAGNGIGFASEFTIVHAWATLKYTGASVPLAISGQYFTNPDAAGGLDDDGFALGAEVGSLGGVGKWRARYQYQEVGQESVYSAFAQDDFLNATNFRGHVAAFTVKIHPQANANLWALLSAREAPRIDTLQKRYRLDINVSF